MKYHNIIGYYKEVIIKKKNRLKIFLLCISLLLVLTACVDTSGDDESGIKREYVRNRVKVTEEEAKRQDEEEKENLDYYEGRKIIV